MSKLSSELNAEQVAADLAVFADIGTDAPSIELTDQGAVVRMIRQGEQTEIEVRKSGALVESWGSESQKHANFKALLASERYGNLREWAFKQTAFLTQEMRDVGSLIEAWGLLSGTFELVDVSKVDDHLCSPQSDGSTRVLLIDGPAGIGKTQFIASLATQRANSYTSKRRPLLLHVQSRGRTLTYLYDLVAFSLQRLRLDVTFDQVPILAKYGLITIAIDGFDELADPDGYNNAWSQVSDLIETLRGDGSIILAGRETFIGRDRVVKDIKSVREGKDEINVLTLQPPSKSTAVGWLAQQGWNDDQINLIEDFLEPNSLALRPFFLKTLSDPSVAASLSGTAATSVLSILMEAMIERETGLFGEAIQRVLNHEQRRQYLRSLLCEAARDMAESNSSSISDATLTWLVEIALPIEIDEAATRILKARSQAIAFFTNDDRPGYRRFFHDKFYEYFLSLATVQMISSEETGRILSRNILGSSFLETFGDVVGSALDEASIKRFCAGLMSMFATYPPVDRTRKNLGALAIASLTVAEFYLDYSIRDIDLDECRVAGTASGGRIEAVVINQLDCRGANLAFVDMANVTVYSLIADQETVLPDGFPTPIRIRDINAPGGTIFAPLECAQWVKAHLENPPIADDAMIPANLRSHEAVRLLQKACRMRQYWLRESDDVHASKILEHDWWPVVQEALNSNGLLTIEDRQASGVGAPFIHIRRRGELLLESSDDPEIRKFYRDLVTLIMQR